MNRLTLGLIFLFALLVDIAATVQHWLVLGVELELQYYIVPNLVGGVFGFLLAKIHELRVKLRRNLDALATREATITELNHQLSQTVIEQRDNLRETEAQLAQAQKMEAVGTLASGIAHDFNNLLTAVIGSAEVLREVITDPLDQQMVLDIISAGERGAGLVRQLLSFSQHAPRYAALVNPNDTVAEMCSMLRWTTGQNISLELDLSPSTPDVWMDQSEFEQVILNFVVNARDAMPEGGVIRIKTGKKIMREDGKEVELAILSVKDDGCGMDEETQARVFEPFFTTKGIGRGTGLGLAVVYGIAERMKGEVSIDSVVNEGTTVTLTIPAAPHVTTQPQALQMKETLQVQRSGRRVLVVDDEHGVRNMLTVLLERHGLSVRAAEGKNSALGLLQDTDFDPELILCDLVLRDGDGFSLADEIRATHPTIAIVFMSAFAGDLSSKPLGPMTSFLQKPFSPRELFFVIDAALSANTVLRE